MTFFSSPSYTTLLRCWSFFIRLPGVTVLSKQYLPVLPRLKSHLLLFSLIFLRKLIEEFQDLTFCCLQKGEMMMVRGLLLSMMKRLPSHSQFPLQHLEFTPPVQNALYSPLVLLEPNEALKTRVGPSYLRCAERKAGVDAMRELKSDLPLDV